MVFLPAWYYIIWHIVMIYFRLFVCFGFMFCLFVFMCELTLWFPVMGWIKCSVLSTRFALSCSSGFYLHKRVHSLTMAICTVLLRMVLPAEESVHSNLTMAICTVLLQRFSPAEESAAVWQWRFALCCYNVFYPQKRVQQFDNGDLHYAVTTGFTRRRECSSLTMAICTMLLQRVLPAGESAAAWQWRRGRSRGGRERWPAGSLPPPRPSAGRHQTRGCSGTQTRLETSQAARSESEAMHAALATLLEQRGGNSLRLSLGLGSVS